jgi:uncharacterized protein (TIGR00369 family)
MDVPPVAEINAHLRGFDRLYGLEFVELGDELARAQVVLSDDHKQPLGLAHGGLFASIAESLSSVATALSVRGEGHFAVGQSNNTTFLRPITAGTVHAVARRRHRGRTTWLWDVEILDDDGRLCAMSRMTIAVRPLRTRTR